MAYRKKNYFLGQMSHLEPRMSILPHNSGSTLRIFLQFCSVEGAKKDMRIILMVFLKEILFRAI